jgi:hypothetical protein
MRGLLSIFSLSTQDARKPKDTRSNAQKVYDAFSEIVDLKKEASATEARVIEDFCFEDDEFAIAIRLRNRCTLRLNYKGFHPKLNLTLRDEEEGLWVNKEFRIKHGSFNNRFKQEKSVDPLHEAAETCAYVMRKVGFTYKVAEVAKAYMGRYEKLNVRFRLCEKDEANQVIIGELVYLSKYDDPNATPRLVVPIDQQLITRMGLQFSDTTITPQAEKILRRVCECSPKYTAEYERKILEGEYFLPKESPFQLALVDLNQKNVLMLDDHSKERPIPTGVGMAQLMNGKLAKYIPGRMVREEDQESFDLANEQVTRLLRDSKAVEAIKDTLELRRSRRI